MKIAVAFLLLGLSSCFVSTNALSLKLCTGKLTKNQGETLATMLVTMIQKYGLLKRKGMEFSCQKMCLIDSAFRLARLLAGFKQCPEDFVIDEVLACMKLDRYSKARLKEAFMNDDAKSAVGIVVEINALFDALCCVMAKIYAADGLDLMLILNGLLSGLGNFLGDLLDVVSSLLAGSLGVSVNHVTGLLTGTVPGLLGGVLGLVNGIVG